MTERTLAPRLIAESVYWLGTEDNFGSLLANVYMIYRNGKALIIDPGPRSDFKAVLRAAEKVAPREALTALVLSDREPDVCSSLPAWEEEGFQGRLILHRANAPFIGCYGLLSPLSPLSEGSESLEAAGGLVHIPLTLRNAPGLLLTYDPLTQTLFSSHLFGAWGERNHLFADESYYRGVSVGLRDLFSSAEETALAAERLGNLSIRNILPQHGCLITENAGRYLDLLRENLSYPEIREKEEEEWALKQFALNEELVLSSDEKILDPITGLYNGIFFQNFLPHFIEGNPKGTIACFRIDNMKTFNNTFGFKEGDRAIATFASQLQAVKPEDTYLFREAGPTLFFMLPDGAREVHEDILERLQNRIRESRDFVQDMTCSVAAVRIEDLPAGEENRADLAGRILRHRLQLLDIMGPHSLCLSSDADEEISENRVLLIIDSDLLCARILIEYFEQRNFTTHLCTDGGEALHLMDIYRPHFVISEIKVPQMDGFRIREKMLQSQDLRNIPFLFLSHLKSEDSVERAQKLGVLHNLRKPVMLSEIGGIVGALTRGESGS